METFTGVCGVLVAAITLAYTIYRDSKSDSCKPDQGNSRSVNKPDSSDESAERSQVIVGDTENQTTQSG